MVHRMLYLTLDTRALNCQAVIECHAANEGAKVALVEGLKGLGWRVDETDPVQWNDRAAIDALISQGHGPTLGRLASAYLLKGQAGLGGAP